MVEAAPVGLVFLDGLVSARPRWIHGGRPFLSEVCSEKVSVSLKRWKLTAQRSFVTGKLYCRPPIQTAVPLFSCMNQLLYSGSTRRQACRNWTSS